MVEPLVDKREISCKLSERLLWWKIVYANVY